jgi:hypothetical protein
MRLPSFTAQASLDVQGHRYRKPTAAPVLAETGAISPQLGGKTFQGFGGCVSDCMDQHPGWSRTRCAKACRDPLSGVDLSTATNEVNGFLSSLGIDAWEVGCSALIHPELCRRVADGIRRQS